MNAKLGVKKNAALLIIHPIVQHKFLPIILQLGALLQPPKK